MKLVISLWLSLLNSLGNFFDFLESSVTKKSFWRFVFGCIAGIFPALIYWGYAIFFAVNIPLTQGIIGSLILMFSFGIAAVYGNFGKLFEGLNL